MTEIKPPSLREANEEMKRASWVKSGKMSFKCPLCGGDTVEPTKFCPHCGKEMNGIKNPE